MIEIRHDLPLNKPKKGSAEEAPIEVHYEAQTEGKTVAKGKGNSILYGFLAGLWLNAGQFRDLTSPLMEQSISTNNSVYAKVTSVTEANGTVRVFVDSTSSSFYTTNWYYWLHQIPGTNIGGLYRVKNRNSSLQYIDIIDGETGDDLQLVGTPDLSTHSPHARRTASFNNHPRELIAHRDTLEADDLNLGVSFGDPQEVSLMMSWVDNHHQGILDQSPNIINAPVIGDNESFIQFTRDYTNNNADEVSINAIMLSGQIGAHGSYPLAVDAVNIAVPSGNTVTINYRIRISNDASGGLLWQFTELLYRQLARVFRESRNIFNSNRTTNNDVCNFWMHGSGANTLDTGIFDQSTVPRANRNNSSTQMYLLGPQVGMGTSDVINTNIDLADRLLPGTGTDRLVFYGSHVTPIVIDEVSGEAYFDVVRAFENRSGSAISIAETGLNCAGYGTGDDTPQQFDTHCIARHRLATPVSVPDGEMLRLTYRIKVVV